MSYVPTLALTRRAVRVLLQMRLLSEASAAPSLDRPVIHSGHPSSRPPYGDESLYHHWRARINGAKSEDGFVSAVASAEMDLEAHRRTVPRTTNDADDRKYRILVQFRDMPDAEVAVREGVSRQYVNRLRRAA